MKALNLMIVDDHRMFRNGIKALLKEQDFIGSVAEASNGVEFLDYIHHNSVDVVLMDINMPVMNGIEATCEAVKFYPGILIIALSMLSDEDYYFQMIHAGAKGFILKDSGSDELIMAIKSVVNGQNFYSQELLRSIIVSLSTNSTPESSLVNEKVLFSKRELEVLEHICFGESNQEIAEKLFISTRTVERHRANLYSKTGSKNSVNLVMYAIKNNLVKV